MDLETRMAIATGIYEQYGHNEFPARYRQTLLDRGYEIKKALLYKDRKRVHKEFIERYTKPEYFIEKIRQMERNMEVWQDGHPNAYIGAMKLLSDWLDFPANIRAVTQRPSDTREISKAEYREYLYLKSKENDDG